MSNFLFKIFNNLTKSDNDKSNKKEKKSKSEKQYKEDRHKKNKSTKHKEKLLCEELECEVKQRYVQKKPLPPNINTVLALYEPEVFPPDQIFIESIYFCWYQDPTLPRFPILYTNGTVQNYLDILNEYYAKGYRYFLGFSRSTIVAGVLQWFLDHPDTIGISLTSGAYSLAVPKNIYRLVSQLDTIVNSLAKQYEQASTVYCIYDINELISENVYELLKNNYLTKNKLKAYPVVNQSSLNVTDLNIFFSDSQPNDVVVLATFEAQIYANLYNDGVNCEGNQYTVAGVAIDIQALVEPSASILSNKYFIISNVSPTTSLLWRRNEEYLVKKGLTAFDPAGTANALKMIQSFINNKNIDYLGSYSGTLQFNENKDLKYYSYLFLQYTIEDGVKIFKKSSLSFNDPLLGTFEATFI
jgi:hypothetical protein